MFCQKHGDVKCIIYENDTKSGCEKCLDENARPMKSAAQEMEEEELAESFSEWFTALLFQQESCLYRDVLRDCRKELKAAFLVRKPVWTTVELDNAKTEASRLYKVLNGSETHS